MRELSKSEDRVQTLLFLYDMFLLSDVPIPDVLSYDDACVIAASLTREIALL